MTTIKTPPKQQQRKSNPVYAEYEQKVKDYIRDEMQKAGVSYDELAHRINQIGIDITARGLENKISRGSFSAAFLFQCMDAIKR